MPKKPFKKALKIDRFRVKFSHRRRGAVKKWMAHLWKIILRRFRISNQIFHSIYGSRDIERSLDTTFAVFGQNWHFMDEYLENRAKFGHAVFAGCSILISSTFWSILAKIVICAIIFGLPCKQFSICKYYYKNSTKKRASRASALRADGDWHTRHLLST